MIAQPRREVRSSLSISIALTVVAQLAISSLTPSREALAGDSVQDRVRRAGGLESVRARLEARADYQRKGDSQAASDELRRLLALADEIEAPNIPLASAVLINDARQALGEGRPERAIQFADAAVKLSPQMAAAHWIRAKALLAYNFSWSSATGASIQALLCKLRGFRNQVAFLSELLSVLGLSMLGAILGFALLQSLKYLRYTLHDLRKNTRFSDVQSIVLVVMVLLGPVMIRAGPIPTAIVWLLFAAAYQTTRELRVSAAALMILGFSPIPLYLMAVLLGFHGSSSDMFAVASGELLDQRTEQRLAEEKNDPVAALLLGTHARQVGRMGAARRWLSRATELTPDSPVAHNNLGNVYFEMGARRRAEEEYRRALKSGAIEPKINLGLLLNETNRAEEGKAFLSEAWESDPEKTQRHSGAGMRRLADMTVDDAHLWIRLLALPSTQRRALMDQLGGSVGGRFAWWTLPFLAMGGGVLMLIMRGPRSRLCVPCSRCLRPTDRLGRQRQCVSCVSTFGLGASPGNQDERVDRDRIVREIEKRRTRIRRFGSLLAGGGHILGNRPLSGLALLLLLMVAVFAGWGDRVASNAWEIWAGPENLSLYLSVPLAVVVEMISLVTGARERER